MRKLPVVLVGIGGVLVAGCGEEERETLTLEEVQEWVAGELASGRGADLEQLRAELYEVETRLSAARKLEDEMQTRVEEREAAIKSIHRFEAQVKKLERRARELIAEYGEPQLEEGIGHELRYLGVKLREFREENERLKERIRELEQGQ